MKIFCLSDNTDTQTGLRLAGIPGSVVHTGTEFNSELVKVLADKETGILLVTEKLAKQFPEAINEVRLNRRLPLIVEIPDRHGTGRSADFITEYVCNAIGIKL